MSGLSELLEGRSPSVVVIATLGVLYIIYRLIHGLLTYRRQARFIAAHNCKPYASYPHADPVFGLDLFRENVRLSRDGGLWSATQDRYRDLKASNGASVHTFSQLLLGQKIINTCEPENVKAILATQFRDFELASRRANLEPVFGHGIFTTDGPEWEASRALLRPNFVRGQIADVRLFEKHSGMMIKRIPRGGETVDLQELFFMLTIDSATEFLFGHSTNVLGTGISTARGEKFADAFTYATEKIGFKGRVGRLGALFPDARWDSSVRFIHEYVGDYVQRAISKSKDYEKNALSQEEASRYVFLNELARAGYSPKKIQDELLNILLAGRDTTASLLSFVFYTLARRPDVFEKLRAEVLGLGGENPTFEQIKEMKYLQYVLNETLRLYPIVPSNGRNAVRDTTLPVGGGPDGKSPIFLAKGQAVNYQVYVMHRRKDLYGEDAEEFRPERWETLRPSWQYLPFNGGPRICIGQQFALTEASYTTIKLLQAFKKIEPRDSAPLRELQTLTMAVRGGVQVGLTPA